MLELEILELRANHWTEIHKYWTGNKDSWDKAQNIKQEILKAELGGSKKFYIYKRFIDWDNNRFESEILDITNKEIALINPTYFNDPYDCRLPPSIAKEFMKNNKSIVGRIKLNKAAKNFMKKDLSGINLSKYERKKEAKKLQEMTLKKNIEKESKIMTENIRNDFRIACFATKPDDMYFWSHYGGVHKGYCVEYTLDDEMFNKFMYPVKYSQEFPRFHFKENKLAITLFKSTDWIKEKEWRLLNRLKVEDKDRYSAGRKFPLNNSQISAIYLGLDFNQESNEVKLNSRQKELNAKKESLLNACKDIDVFQMKLLDDKFGMTPVKL